MTCEVEKRGGIVHIRGEMTIYHAASVKDCLLGALEGESEFRLDLSEISEVDTTGVQILLMARRMSGPRGATFSILNPSDVMNESLALLRLDNGMAGSREESAA